VSLPKQTTAKIRSTADRAHIEADIESVPRPRRWVPHWPHGSGRYRLKWRWSSPAPTTRRVFSPYLNAKAFGPNGRLVCQGGQRGSADSLACGPVSRLMRIERIRL
jgi:hypothetical protein